MRASVVAVAFGRCARAWKPKSREAGHAQRFCPTGLPSWQRRFKKRGQWFDARVGWLNQAVQAVGARTMAPRRHHRIWVAYLLLARS